MVNNPCFSVKEDLCAPGIREECFFFWTRRKVNIKANEEVETICRDLFGTVSCCSQHCDQQLAIRPVVDMKTDLLIHFSVCLFVMMHNLISGNQMCKYGINIVYYSQIVYIYMLLMSNILLLRYKGNISTHFVHGTWLSWSTISFTNLSIIKMYIWFKFRTNVCMTLFMHICMNIVWYIKTIYSIYDTLNVCNFYDNKNH